jgi:hypothetical protein
MKILVIYWLKVSENTVLGNCKKVDFFVVFAAGRVGEAKEGRQNDSKRKSGCF